MLTSRSITNFTGIHRFFSSSAERLWMRPKPATKRASRGVMRQNEKSASLKLIACSGKRASQASFGPSVNLHRFPADRHAHQRERIGAAVVGLGDRERDARVLRHVLRVPGEPADVHVERGEIRAPAGTASSTPSARRRAACRGGRRVRCGSGSCRSRRVSASIAAIVVVPALHALRAHWSACATRARGAATASSASTPRSR